jgi:uncharacterized protein
MTLPCPCCSEGLNEVQVGSCRVDRCSGCRGIWFDYQELQRLCVETPEALAALDAPAAEPGAGPRLRHCPRCRQALSPFALDGWQELPADRCNYCGGIWLDAGEAGGMLEHRGKGERPLLEKPAEERQADFYYGSNGRAGLLLGGGGATFGLGSLMAEALSWSLD